LKTDALLGSALVDTYAKCGDLAKAQAVFDNEVRIRNVVSWTALITAYSQYGHGEEALECFEQMQKEGYAPNSVTFAGVLKACGSIRALNKGIQVHADLIREGLLQRDVLLGTALVDMYAKCGDLAKAQQTFNELQNRDVVAWNALISGYAQHGHGEEALCCFRHMRQDNVPPNAVTFVCILKACGILGASGKGQEIHTAIIRGKFLQENVILGYALVDMYAKCGALAKAREVFDELPFQDVVAWNGLISGYAQLGAHEVVFGAFDEMIEKGVEPTAVTFTALLNACSHSGLLEKGKVYFDMMSLRYGIIPTLEHHTCMVDLFSRAGIVDKAMTIMSEMQFPADLAMCHSLLSACGRWGNVNVGRLAFQHAVQLDEQDVGAYVCLGNMYASCDGKSPTEIADWKLTNKVGID
jgi:pentatricopeptide repeat protein